MAATITPNAVIPNDVWGKIEIRFITLVDSAADYATGGYALTAGQGISLGAIYFVIPVGGQGGYVPVWNPATGKLQIFEQSAATSALTEVPNATDLSAITFNLLIFGN
jgi:hypothetical protein